jgi:hypothetical protein
MKLETPPFPIEFATNKDGNILDIALYCCVCVLKSPTICLKGKSQCFCLASQAALPPDEDVPVLCTYCFVTCFPKFGVMMKVSDAVAPPAK